MKDRGNTVKMIVMSALCGNRVKSETKWRPTTVTVFMNVTVKEEESASQWLSELYIPHAICCLEKGHKITPQPNFPSVSHKPKTHPDLQM